MTTIDDSLTIIDELTITFNKTGNGKSMLTIATYNARTMMNTIESVVRGEKADRLYSDLKSINGGDC